MSPRSPSTGVPHLVARRKAGRTYYAYKHPITGREHGMGTDKAAAQRAARILNNRLAVHDDAVGALVAAVDAGGQTAAGYARAFAERLPELRNRRGKPLATATRREYARQLERFAADHAHLALEDLSRRHVATWLAGFPATASNRYRAVLSLMCRYAVAEGLIEHNPVAGTLAQPEEVQRTELHADAYHAILAAASPLLSRAMRLALLTLQRREDLVSMRFADYQGRVLRVQQHKTGARLAIAADDVLDALVAECRADGIASPFILHTKPRRRVKSDRREHWTQVMPETLSREFAAARESAGVHAHLEPAARPTFHELRSLGAALYRRAGIDPQPLLGHTDAKSTAGYLEGHELWEPVAADLGTRMKGALDA